MREAAPVGDGAGIGVCDDVNDGGLAAGVGPLQGGFDLGGVFDFFAIAPRDSAISWKR